MKRYLEVRSLKEDLKRFEERYAKDYNPYDYGELPPEAFGNNPGGDIGDDSDAYVDAINNGTTYAGSTTGPRTPSIGIMPPPSKDFTTKSERVQSFLGNLKKKEREYRARLAGGKVTPEEKAAHDKLKAALRLNSRAAWERGTKK